MKKLLAITTGKNRHLQKYAYTPLIYEKVKI